jgi:carboxypeptidase Taq
MTDAYRRLEARFRRYSTLGDALAMLQWDSAVMMPRASGEVRAGQLAALKRTRHDLLTADDMADLLDGAAADTVDDPWRIANLREMRRVWVHQGAIDGDLLEAASHAEARCEMMWRAARPARDFAAVAPALEQVVALQRRIAEAKAAALGCAPYEALMDQFEPGARIARIDALFDDLAGFLPDFLAAVLERQAREAPPVALSGPFPLAAQRALGERLMTTLGFDFARGRLDVSVHPFCGGVPGDIRITTRYEADDFTQALMGILHETGHALYEAGLPEAWRHQPVGAARGMAAHESQSLLMEMQTCRGRAFIDFAAPLMRAAFAGSGPGWEADNLYRLHTTVAPGPIRVDADEVSYPAHVILRYRLEQALLDGELAVADLPIAWNEAMEALLGLRPADDAEGCLQDIHWFDGAFGYFPTYTLGALAAAQLFAAALAVRPGIPAAIAAGDFAPLVGWLRDNVHARASLAPTTDALLVEATGAALGSAAFKAHLTARYGA